MSPIRQSFPGGGIGHAGRDRELDVPSCPVGGLVPLGHSQRQRPSSPHCPPLETHGFTVSTSSAPYSLHVLCVLQASLPEASAGGHWARSPSAPGCCLFFPEALPAPPVPPGVQGEPPWTNRGRPPNVTHSWGRDMEPLRTCFCFCLRFFFFEGCLDGSDG